MGVSIMLHKEIRMSTRYPFPDIQGLPEDLRTKILEVQEKAGFVPLSLIHI